MFNTKTQMVLWCLALVLSAQSRTSAQAPEINTRVDPEVHVRDQTPNAFGFPFAVLNREDRRAFAVGNAFFRDNWVAAPSSVEGRDGLGPLFNAASCGACHFKDGRSSPPEANERGAGGLLVRIGVRSPGSADLPHPVYGAQIQDDAIPGARPEAKIGIVWTTVSGTHRDGRTYELRRPHLEFTEEAWGAFGENVVLGVRSAPAVFGLGLVEAIAENDLLSRVDPADLDGDGISGRAHWLSRGNDKVPGRFGWKATQPDLRHQIAAALKNDMGLTTSIFPEDMLTPVQRRDIRLPDGGRPELSDEKLDRLIFYVQMLAVPAPRRVSPEIEFIGQRLFQSARCDRCHTPEYRTSTEGAIPTRGRWIAPYSDFLLHDLGPGLADEKVDGDALAGEWRTPPLWGLGLIPVVNGHMNLLHDGRARGVAEAILWHGGEATFSQEFFRALTPYLQSVLVQWIESL